MIGVVEVVVVALEAEWQATDNPRRKLLATTAPLLLGIALDKLLVDIATNERECLLLEVARLALKV